MSYILFPFISLLVHKEDGHSLCHTGPRSTAPSCLMAVGGGVEPSLLGPKVAVVVGVSSRFPRFWEGVTHRGRGWIDFERQHPGGTSQCPIMLLTYFCRAIHSPGRAILISPLVNSHFDVIGLQLDMMDWVSLDVCRVSLGVKEKRDASEAVKSPNSTGEWEGEWNGRMPQFLASDFFHISICTLGEEAQGYFREAWYK